MLGDLIFEAQGKVNSMRLLPNRKLEQEATMQGEFLGEEFSAIYTVRAEHKSDRTGHIELEGPLTTASGATVQGIGIGNGTRMPDGKMFYRGAMCYSAPPSKFARLNGIAVIWEMEADVDGSIQGRGWEWK